MGSSADDLRRRILELFAGKVEDSREIEKLLGKIQSGGNYKDAEAFAWLVGNALASAYSEIKTEIPEIVDETFSRLILEDPLKRDYDVVSGAAVTVQQSLNDEAGLGLKAQPPRLNRSRVEGLIKKFAGYEKSKDGLWLLGAPIVTFSQSVADDTLKKNADFQYKAGLRPRIIRDDAYGCCEWCSRIAGTYNYPNVPKDVFKRHENCRCTVDYDPAAGKRIQDVWTKRSTIREDSGKIEKRKQVGNDEAEMTRRKVAEDGHEIIDQPTYNKLTRDFLRRGGVIIRGEEAMRNLDFLGAHAAYILGENVAFIRDDATVSDVLEEMYHAEQDRRKLFADADDDRMWLLREIDAQEYLEKMADKYKIPENERITTRTNLENYRKELELLEQGGTKR